jgi:hypothetical protein
LFGAELLGVLVGNYDRVCLARARRFCVLFSREDTEVKRVGLVDTHVVSFSADSLGYNLRH